MLAQNKLLSRNSKIQFLLELNFFQRFTVFFLASGAKLRFASVQ